MTRFLGALDAILHRSLDWYINLHGPGWGRLQVWQHWVCDFYERRRFGDGN